MNNPKKFREFMWWLLKYLPGVIILGLFIAFIYSYYFYYKVEPKNEHKPIEKKIKSIEYDLMSYETELIELQFKFDSLKVLAPIIEKFKAPYVARLDSLGDKYLDDGTKLNPVHSSYANDRKDSLYKEIWRYVITLEKERVENLKVLIPQVKKRLDSLNNIYSKMKKNDDEQIIKDALEWKKSIEKY